MRDNPVQLTLKDTGREEQIHLIVINNQITRGGQDGH